MSRVQPARRVALDVLRAVSDDDAYSNLLLPSRIARARLDAADAGLATELTYGTLRLQGYYDRVIAIAARRAVEKIDPALLDVLRLGVHQLLSTRVATHAAVDESVELAREVGSRSATGFVNGVLRTVSRTTPDAWRERVLAGAVGVDDRLSAEWSHPAWVVRAFRQSLTAEARGDELVDLLEADNQAPRVSLVALPGLAEVAELGGPGGVLSPVAATNVGGDPSNHPAVREGRARVQDEGSQLAALMLSRHRPVVGDERWLDMCAGPGGKAALLGAEAARGGARLLANELVPARAGLVRQALESVPGEIEVLEGDATRFGSDRPGSFDRILLDAPCTGLGALRRRPEARWRKQPRDVGELTELQARLFTSAVDALAPGGVLAYVTCSPHVAETRAIVETGVRGRDELTVVDATETARRVVGSPVDLGSAPYVQLWPHRHGTDAMFVALIEKRR
ncbi:MULTISPECIES: RsmB/NOP family class I SAM-dependent RNA methyltransferase [unclassified Frigoribacterium]|uniref:RsmB/NOP family class I SAM-dependent RNA methyltransferase n=1 Tax=unclassified Frigoribacterium TaxID=2627005 RepID=UPI0007015D3C|nr:MULTISPECIES: transcription antitermination factor NusB [unclassified Frigoribacterium]KQO82861.1 methyltransferase [Frigoribacterium sp. Leaf263]KQR64444.1 methyltransferase [Frigoribacterium sp. Leaf172]